MTTTQGVNYCNKYVYKTVDKIGPVFSTLKKGKGKGIEAPLQVWSGTEGTRKLR
jgi:hypothetical protein